MNKNKSADASERPLDLIVSPLPCPFCGAAPEEYTIGERPRFGEKGEKMVRCKSGGCGMYGNPMSFDKWQTRANDQGKRDDD